MSHHCSTAVVRCIDFRLNQALQNYLENYGIGNDFDLISAAGGVKDWTYVLSQIDLSKKLHEIRQVILLNHTDCGGYGGRQAFASEDEEKQRHVADLKAAQKDLEKRFPGLIVHPALADIQSSNRVHIETL